MIFTLDHITRITALEKGFQTNNLKEDYLRRAFKVVNKPLVKYFHDQYLLHRAYFIEADGNLSVLKFEDIETLQDPISLAQIELAEALVQKSKSIPFTKIILDKHAQGMVLYSGQKPDSFGRIISQNLNASLCYEKLSIQLGIGKKVIKPLVESYQNHSRYLRRPFYAYFIRPFAEHRVYNGILLFLLGRSLKENEYIELGSLWTKMLSETALLKIQATEQDFIFEEQTHTWHTDITSITQHLDYATKELSQGNILALTEISESVNYAYVKVQHLRTINAFNLFLLKTRDVKTWEEAVSLKQHIGDEDLFKELELSIVNLNEVLNESVIILNSFINSLEHADPEMTKKELLAIEDIGSQIQKFEEYKLYTIYTGLKIILVDLLKNALLHADLKSPQVEIRVITDEDFLHVHILNNSPLPKGAFDFINNNKQTNDMSIRRKGGIRTIKRIIDSYLLGSSGQKWKLHATPESLKGRTEIILSIPKSDVHE